MIVISRDEGNMHGTCRIVSLEIRCYELKVNHKTPSFELYLIVATHSKVTLMLYISVLYLLIAGSEGNCDERGEVGVVV